LVLHFLPDTARLAAVMGDYLDALPGAARSRSPT
jgi:hypothetical protein